MGRSSSRGNKPMAPDNLLKRYIRPALERASMVGRVIAGTTSVICWRRTANVMKMLDIYTQWGSQKRDVNAKVGEMMYPLFPKSSSTLQHPRCIWVQPCSVGKSLVLMELLVDLIGIEPLTSSMPWKCRKRKLLTAKWLDVGKKRQNRPHFDTNLTPDRWALS